MGKKKKKKRQRKNKKFNKNQFIDIVCKQCQICVVYNPYYCYTSAYCADPDTFMKQVYPRLLGAAARFNMGGDLLMPEFRGLFCYSGICGTGAKMSCKDSVTCYNTFTDQVVGKPLKGSKAKPRKKKKDDPVIFEPYATFFISDNADFRKEIEGILSDGNRDIEQNNDKRSAVPSG